MKGNCLLSLRSFEIWAFKWLALIWSFDGYGDEAKQRVTPREPWRQLLWIFAFRAMGAYSHDEYKKYFNNKKIGVPRLYLIAAAAFPGRLANALNVFLLVLTGRCTDDAIYDLITCSRYSNPVSRFLARIRPAKTHVPVASST